MSNRWVFIFGTLCIVAIPLSVDARPWRVDQFPNGSLFGCAGCHIDPGGGGPRNPFGEGVRPVVSIGGDEEFWEPLFAEEDSDGDGKTNGEELLDPAGTWVTGDPDPGDPDAVTHPGVVDAPPPDGEFIRGDSNGDLAVNIADAIATLNALFGDAAGSDCEKAADANADEQVNIADAIYTLNRLFGTGAPIPPPTDECGLEEEETALTCESSPC